MNRSESFFKGFGFATGIMMTFALAWMIREHTTRANMGDCVEIGHRLHGTSHLEEMPDGVKDLCVVDRGDGDPLVVQVR